ncbi:MAG: ABC transporter ATP-binding protein/permease [Pirellulales bacterium]|nr:ABC transporter ATP-binding protein/permease [Pirellulales bacterium]
MSSISVPSRRRFAEYQREVRRRRQAGEKITGGFHAPARPAGPKHRSFGRLFVEFWGLLRGQHAAIGFALGTLTISTLLRLIPPATTKLIVDVVLVPGGNSLFDSKQLAPWSPEWLPPLSARESWLYLLAGAVVAITVVESLVHLWGRWYATRIVKRVQVNVRRKVFEHAVQLPLHRVYQIKSGGVASILREDAGGVAELVFSMLYNPWRAIVQLIGSLIVLAVVDWRLLLGSLALLPTIYLTHRTWIGRIRPLYRDIRLRRQEVDGHATEVFGGMRVVRGFDRGRSETGRYARGSHLMARQELNAWWWTRLVELLWEFLLPLASAGLMLYGGMQVVRGELTLGDLMMFLAYLAMLLGPLAVLANSATQFQGDLAGLDRVLDLLAEPVELPRAADAIMVQPRDVTGAIRLRDVSFAYPGHSERVLRHVDLEVPAGSTVALVGPSGAGKTTLSNLVARFYDPTEGRIELDGIDLRKLDVESYRRLLGIVEQEVFLFDGTVADNISYAKRHATPEQIHEAARLANADEFIRALPAGYDTIIGERGVRLSGGQRQRLAIARAVLANPRILILDEATSNLDTESERLIQRSLASLLRGRTSFVIAHRLSTIRHADIIVVLEHGEIVEQGTHDELMAASGRYRHMVHLQLGSPEIEEPLET